MVPTLPSKVVVVEPLAALYTLPLPSATAAPDLELTAAHAWLAL